MNLIYKYLSLFVFVGLFFGSCKDDINRFTPNEIDVANYGKVVSTNIGGVVFDEAGKPLENVEIAIGAMTVSTDKNGVFLLKDVSVQERKAYVQAKKSGYFNGSRTLSVQKEKTHYVAIQMLEKTPSGSFQTSDGGIITIEGAQIDFPANAIRLKDGGSYSGTVNVAAKHLNPIDDEVFNKMPGALRGERTKGNEALLTTYGMVVAELTGDNGEELQIADGSKAKLTMQLPSSISASAPSSIPLWHFDETKGMWIEEGEAILENGSYSGDVAHFSWWNCDFPYPYDRINVKAQIIDVDGNPVPDVHVVIRVVGDRWGGHGLTNSDGYICGGAPKGLDLELVILGPYSSPCSRDILFNHHIGVLTEDTDLGAITFIVDPNAGMAIPYHASGRVIDCDDNPVTNGYVTVKTSTKRSHIVFLDDTDGTFGFQNYVCSPASSITVTGFDLDNLLQTDDSVFPISTDIALGDLKACSQLDQYITYTLDGNKFTIPNPRAYKEADATYISAEIDSTSTFINFAVDAVDAVGTFPLVDTGQDFVFSVNNYFRVLNSTINVTFTRYDSAPDGYVVGSLIGTFDDGSNTPPVQHNISANFRVKRIQ